MGNRLNLSANDNTRYKYHTDIIRLFGKDLKAHMTATYKIDEDWRIWFPKVYQNSDYINKLSEDGTSFEMNQLPESELTAQLIFPEDEPGNRLIFAHHKDPDTKENTTSSLGYSQS